MNRLPMTGPCASLVMRLDPGADGALIPFYLDDDRDRAFGKGVGGEEDLRISSAP
jgi:hypothetical protein